MKERKLFQEIPGRRNDFHSAILTSYSFNFHHFEYQVLRTLRQKWITNIAVLADQHMLDGSIGLASGNLKQLSQSYSVNGVRSSGAFHPKINFFIGDEKLLLFFGSGNITPGGHGKNHELFTTFYADSKDSKQLPILQEAWNYLEGLSQDVAGFNKERITRQIVSNSSLLKRKEDLQKHTFHALDEGIEVALLYNDSTSIYAQLVDHIPANDIARISIICPYFDEDGTTLLALANHFDQAVLDIFIPAEFGLPPVKIATDKRINFYKWEETKRGKQEISGDSTYKRKLHSKIFHFEATEREFLILGSANATRAGLGTPDHRGANDEFCALYRSSNIDFLGELGIKGKKSANVKELTRSTFVIGAEAKDTGKHHKAFITGVDIRSHSLHVYLKSPLQEERSFLILYDSHGEEVHRIEMSTNENDEFTHNLPSEALRKELSYVEIIDLNGNYISNKQLINHLDKLFHTDPSKANRSINQVINGLETGAINEFEILAYLNDVNQAKELDKIKQARLGTREEKPDEAPTVEMSYDEAVEAAKNPLKREKIIRTHNCVRLWESISKMLLDTIQRRDDELEDEEEDADVTKSNKRKNPPPPPPVPKGIKVELLIGQVERLVKKYKSSLTHVINIKDHQIDVIDLVQFLLVTHIVTALTYYNNGEAFRKKKGEGYSDPDWQFRLKDNFKYQMKDILTSFSKLLIRCELKSTEQSEDQYAKDRMSDYKKKTIYNSILYFYLIDRLSPEPFMYAHLELLAFNLFNRLGLTDSQFEQYLEGISRTEEEVMFNASNAIHFRNNLEVKFVDLNTNPEYFRIDHSGWCFVKEQNEHNVRYHSIYGARPISKSKYKNYRTHQS